MATYHQGKVNMLKAGPHDETVNLASFAAAVCIVQHQWHSDQWDHIRKRWMFTFQFSLSESFTSGAKLACTAPSPGRGECQVSWNRSMAAVTFGHQYIITHIVLKCITHIKPQDLIAHT